MTAASLEAFASSSTPEAFFASLGQFCDDLRSEAISRVHIMEKKARSYSYRAEPYIPEPYEPMEKDEYVPAEVFPEPRGQVSMIHKTSFSKREIKKFSREVKYAEVAMVDTPEFIDWSEQSISFDSHAALWPWRHKSGAQHEQACLGEQIGRNIEVYIDDIVVKTKHAATLIDDLRETFDNLDKYKIKLNPKKCFFGVPGGQVLGYFISARGIEANPLKIKAILDMEPPKNLHQVQQLAGRLAALSRFIAKLGEKALPFYNLMKKSEKFEWTKEAQESFDNLKKILSTSPVLVTPREKETLLMYIAATAQVFSSVLVVEREEAGRVHGVQRPVYYLSEVLTPARQRYPHHQKLAYAVWRSARKLRHYFTEHPIVVVSEAPLKNIMTNPEATGRVSQWAIEIAPHDITYVNRTAIKSQILPDFVADWIQSQTPVAPDMSGSWIMYFDGSKRSTGAAAGVVLISPQGDKMKYILRMNFSLPTNNEAEYEALLHGMKMAKACGNSPGNLRRLNLVVQQSMNLCDAVSDNMIAYRQLYQNMEAKFEGCELKHIGRASNEEADTLANIGSMCSPIPDGVFYEVITQRSIKEKAPTPLKPSTEEAEANPQQVTDEAPALPAEQVLLLDYGPSRS
ncbi:hypothetical protein QYE76_053323 [Lolium multiflorum]|uniref:RNase H type-1 domain-containing protein n=1 Tax=Lolium multiflorum TaxID=4521 RepID=A0AAD8SW77_LOLMU|nr:hypothetical protein QYE76_053323 [Lolium multiflorum]